ncbi:hypothetical protein [Alteromonas sp. ASW11-130]|uniref:hypothetical protein n=1 Tax=Alteromonas sp. ASW11-130 TaxID=3015775 RepID=UPI002241E6EB|nr:hypothetical protein [Alteromonas sp. ASW11-130]MCW8090291.1 hypothetical protein [Alteromonas sp. ASW11-130]
MIVFYSMVGMAIYHFSEALRTDEQFVTGIIRSIKDLFIALATYELSISIFKEYLGKGDEDIGLIWSIRRTVTRFVSVLVIALVLEGPILVIKYSQLDLAGNLIYPVAVIIAASILLLITYYLLLALAFFLHWTCQQLEKIVEYERHWTQYIFVKILPTIILSLSFFSNRATRCVSPT